MPNDPNIQYHLEIPIVIIFCKNRILIKNFRLLSHFETLKKFK